MDEQIVAVVSESMRISAQVNAELSQGTRPAKPVERKYTIDTTEPDWDSIQASDRDRNPLQVTT